jgi:hypothetical protein
VIRKISPTKPEITQRGGNGIALIDDKDLGAQ